MTGALFWCTVAGAFGAGAALGAIASARRAYRHGYEDGFEAGLEDYWPSPFQMRTTLINPDTPSLPPAPSIEGGRSGGLEVV